MADNKDVDGIKYRGETPPPKIFNLLFYGLIIWAVIFMGYYLFSGWSSEKEYGDNRRALEEKVKKAAEAKPVAAAGAHKEKDAAAYVAEGKKAYAERCAACHGPEAKGGIGPDLTRKEFKFGRDEKSISQSIEQGRPGGMPAFGGQLSHEQVEGLVKYLLSL
jgi:cytochrome c oxidase cbb3-type subunit 3